MKFLLQEEPIVLAGFAEGLHGEKEGGTVHFYGTARSSSHESPKPVLHLEYEAYGKMAEAEMERIFSEAREKFALEKAVVLHRTGKVELGEAAVAIAVATPHRDEAFRACRYLIDELKKRLPIWKKEIYADGSEWVSCRP